MGCALDDPARAPVVKPAESTVVKRLAYSVTDILQLVGISRSKFYQIVNAGQVKVRKVGKRTIVLAEDLDAWLQSLPSGGGADGPK